MGLLKELVQQSSDSGNRMSANMDTLQHQLAAVLAANGVKLDSLSSQVQSLNDTLDEIKARMARLEKVLAKVQSQQQSIGANLQPAPTTTTASPAATYARPRLRRPYRHSPFPASTSPPHTRPQTQRSRPRRHGTTTRPPSP